MLSKVSDRDVRVMPASMAGKGRGCAGRGIPLAEAGSETSTTRDRKKAMISDAPRLLSS